MVRKLFNSVDIFAIIDLVAAFVIAIVLFCFIEELYCQIHTKGNAGNIDEIFQSVYFLTVGLIITLWLINSSHYIICRLTYVFLLWLIVKFLWPLLTYNKLVRIIDYYKE